MPLFISVFLSVILLNRQLYSVQGEHMYLVNAAEAEHSEADVEMKMLTELLRQKRFSDLSRLLSQRLRRNPGDAGLLDIKKKMVLADYRDAFAASDNAMGTAAFDIQPSLNKCQAGVLKKSRKEMVLRRLNYIRRLAGVPDSCVFTPSADKECQAAAFMMEANGTLSHAPGKTWKCYTAEGARAAASSNLSLGYGFEEALMGQVRDNGQGNEAVGHRRWILNPENISFGFGSTETAMCLKVFGTQKAGILPKGTYPDTQFVAWPSADFFPYNLCPQRWSFSLKDADFSAAGVSMWVNGIPVKVRKEKISMGYALNTLVWVPQAIIPPGAVCKISLSKVGSAGKMKSFVYSTQLLMD